MPRVKGGTTTRARRKKIIKLAKGYFGSKHTLYKTANEQVMHSLKYAYRDRKNLKREMRKLWIARINAGARLNDLSYSKLTCGLKWANISINRKMLSEMAIHDEKGFTAICEIAKEALAKGPVATVSEEVTSKPAVKKATATVAKEEEKKSVAKKPAVKKEATAKKPVAKKEATTKEATKKPAAKKPTAKKPAVKKEATTKETTPKKTATAKKPTAKKTTEK